MYSVAGVAAGDIVYISGGPSGQRRNYSVSNWTPVGGSAINNRVTSQIGQDSAHNGTAVFDCGGGTWLLPPTNFVISGDAGDGNRHFLLTNAAAIASPQSVSGVRISYVNGGASLQNGALDMLLRGPNHGQPLLWTTCSTIRSQWHTGRPF